MRPAKLLRTSVLAAAALALAPRPAAPATTAVAVGSSHTCAIKDGGAVWCWGMNDRGQLGNGATSPTAQVIPVRVAGLGSAAVALAAPMTAHYTCAVTAAGGVWCWGYGPLGGTTEWQSNVPVAISGLGIAAVQVVAGRSHACALTTAGAVWCWGQNYNGQLGDGTTQTRPAPVAVSGLGSGVLSLAAGGQHTCAVTSAGIPWCWGANSSGQLGDCSTTSRSAPVAVYGLGYGVVGVAAGDDHSCAVTIGGAAWCWGQNYNGQLGNGTTTSATCGPVGVSGLGSGVAAISGGVDYTCARTGAGALLCWGSNWQSQLGDGTTTTRYTPVAVTGLASGVAIADAGESHTCAVTSDGALWCWGDNDSGQVGDFTTTGRLTPVRVLGFRPAASDVNGDSRSDVVWRHATGGDLWLWFMSDGSPTAQTYLGTITDTAWQIHGLRDQTRDGKADLLWRHATSGMLYHWTMDGSTVAAEQYIGAVDPAYRIVGAHDYTGDGRSDILWRHEGTGELWLWQMNGAALEAVTRVATVAPAYALVGSGDLNGDGRADILWRHQSSGEVWVWMMNGAVATHVVNLGPVTDLGFEVVAVSDNDADGWAYVIWRHATSGDVWVWRMLGAMIAAVSRVGTVADSGYRIVTVGDYDGDSRTDLLWRHATTGELWVWRMVGGTIASVAWVATVPDVGYQVVNPR